MLTLAMLMAVCPPTPANLLEPLVDPLNACFEEFSVSEGPERQRFIAQYAHETHGFTRLVENLNYTPVGLMATFNTPTKIRFTKEMAEMYGRTTTHSANQMEIANIAYANRMGNGGPETGDGWRFRGKGLCHLTGRDNHKACGDAIGLDLIAHPEQAIEPGPACRVGGWFWKANNLGRIEDYETLTRRINGGLNGLADRIAYLGRAERVIA